MIFDTHAHYDDGAFNEDREKLLNSLAGHGIENVVNIGAGIQSTKNTLQLMKQYPFIYGTVGVYPGETGALNESLLEWLKQAAKEPKVVAVGEIGLDYYWDEPGREVQKHWFIRQLQLAREVGLPVVIHSRNAAKDTLDVMRSQHAETIGGVIHCFSYGVEMAREYLDMGFFIGIGGVVTFQNGKKLKEVVAYIPLDRIVLETDCPYLSPAPNRGKRNSSLNLPYVAEAISQIKAVTPEEVVAVTNRNARALYRLD